MKPIQAIGFLLIILLSFVISPSKALADNTKEQCRNEMLKGRYVFEVSGFFGDQAPFSPAAAVRSVRFDGNGNFSGPSISVLAGNVVEGNILGTYQVQPNCTVNITFTVSNVNGTKFLNKVFGVIVDQGKKIRGINTFSTAGTNTLFENFERAGD